LTNGDNIMEESLRAQVEPETNTTLNTDETIIEKSNRKRGGSAFGSEEKVGDTSRWRRVGWKEGVEFVFEDGGGEAAEQLWSEGSGG
nr:hypothetical protein [Tanacetum cinerariifolium]